MQQTKPPSEVLPYRRPNPDGQQHNSAWKKSLKRKLPAQLPLILMAALFSIPFLFMVMTSLKTLPESGEFPPNWLPRDPQWGNYARVWNHEKIDFPVFARNTVIIALLTTLGTVVSSSLAAYGFAKIRFRGRGPLFVLLLSTMMIPFPVLMVATFSLFRWVHEHTPFAMMGTYRPLWLPAWFGSAFNIFLLRQFFVTVPDELIEAAKIDGAGEFQIYWRIMLPMAIPAIVTVAFFTFMGAWNDFLGPILYIQRPEQYTLAVGLDSFNGQVKTQWNFLMAAALMTIAPVVVIYFILQKAIRQGIATTGLK